ncbi:hypothetical protein MBLNU459_g4785t1 [Dothideomycetes sp. NU459]
MPPRPFPTPFNVGVDIARSDRFLKYFKSTETQLGSAAVYRLFDKMLTPPEQREFWSKYHSLSWIRKHKSLKKCTAHIAGRWAAKEAVIKACSPRKLFMRDIMICTSPVTGAPFGIVLDRRLDDGSTPDAIHSAVRSSLQDGGEEPKPDPTPKSIISQDGQLDLGAVEDALKIGEDEDMPELRSRAQSPTASAQVDDDVEGQIVKVSISHDGDYCVAMCMAPVMDLPGDVGGEAAARMMEL